MTKKDIFLNGAFRENSVWKQILGICSTLAVTNLMLNSLIMGLGLTFALALSSFTISLIRNYTPRSVRMIAQTLIIAAYVIIVDIILKAKLPDISKQLGPYVGLIITNCILMGRAEAFASKYPPLDSLIDGIGAGAGYTLVWLRLAVRSEGPGLLVDELEHHGYGSQRFFPAGHAYLDHQQQILQGGVKDGYIGFSALLGGDFYQQHLAHQFFGHVLLPFRVQRSGILARTGSGGHFRARFHHGAELACLPIPFGAF